MQRVRACAGFAVWFLGLGYVVLWVLGAAAGPCDTAAVLSAFCNLTHPRALPPLVHLAGLLAAIAVFVRLLLIALRSKRNPQDAATAAPAKFLRRMRRPEPTVKRVKAREHFGLRGLPR
jgi:hypothetical protein